MEWQFIDTDGPPPFEDGDFAFPCIAAYESERAVGIVTVPARFAGEFYWADASGKPIETEYRRVVAWMSIPRFNGEYAGRTYVSGHCEETIDTHP